MEEIECQLEQDENKKKDLAEQLDFASNTNIATKEELKQKLFGKDVVKTKIFNVASGMFIQKEKN